MKKMILLVAMSLACATAWAQGTGNEFGTTPEQQQLNRRRLNFLRDQVVREEWGMAAEYLHQLMNEVPAAHPAIYTLAIDMYLKRAKAATDPAQKAMLTDSLIMMHDKYVEYFTGRYPTHGVWYNRAVYIQQLLGDDKARVLEAFRLAAENSGGELPAAVVAYFNELTAAYLRKELPADQYLTKYTELDAMLEGADEQKRQLEQIFVESGAANCETIEAMYANDLDAHSDDAEYLDRIIALLNRRNCKGEFYMTVAEKLYKLKPTAMNARVIAASYRANGDNETAEKFIREALTLVSTPEEKVELLLGMATDAVSRQEYREVYSNASEAANIDQNNVSAHFLMAVATAGGASGCSDATAKRAVYWLAYDRMIETRRLANADPSTKPEMLQEIEANIGRFASAFPTAEDLFIQGIEEGSAYTVNCGWVSGRTTVRRR